MRTTLREKLVLWLIGLSLAASLELLLRSQISPVSPLGVAVIVPTLLILGVIVAFILRYRRP